MTLFSFNYGLSRGVAFQVSRGIVLDSLQFLCQSPLSPFRLRRGGLCTG